MNEQPITRTAEQILDDAASGKLELNQVQIKETCRLTITDLETGEVTERILADGVPRTLAEQDGRLTIT